MQHQSEVKKLPARELILERLSYDPLTGHFTWKKHVGRVAAGQRAGHLDHLGYIRITVDGRLIFAHRLAWLIIYEADPNGILDHINGERADNRIENLRLADKSTNQMNSGPRAGCLSRFKGVSFYAGKWQASIRYKRVSHYIGRFVSEHEAAAAYDEHAVRLFGEFARPNFPLRLQGSRP